MSDYKYSIFSKQLSTAFSRAKSAIGADSRWIHHIIKILTFTLLFFLGVALVLWTRSFWVNDVVIWRGESSTITLSSVNARLILSITEIAQTSAGSSVHWSSAPSPLPESYPVPAFYFRQPRRDYEVVTPHWFWVGITAIGSVVGWRALTRMGLSSHGNGGLPGAALNAGRQSQINWGKANYN